MKLGVILAGLFGLSLAVGLIAWFGLGGVLSSIEAIGWPGFAVFILWQMSTFVPLGAAWFVLALDEPRRRLTSFMWGRQVRESAADVLPFSPIGGLVIGIRAVVLSGVDAAAADGSAAVDLVAEIMAQLVYVIVGLVLLFGRLSRASLAADPLMLAVFVGLVLMVVGAVGFIVVQRRGLGAMDRLMARWMPKAAANVAGAGEIVAEIYKHPWRVALSTALHVFAWFIASVGSWIALRFMGVHLSILAVVTIESLVSAMKSSAFMVPNAAGVQEGGFAVVGALFAMSPETAIALSLLRRARDTVIGVPTLLAWQMLEGRRLFRRKPAPVVLPLEHRS